MPRVPALMLAAFLSGCWFLGNHIQPPPPPGDVEPEIPVESDRYAWGTLAGVPEGAWARYVSPRGPVTFRLVGGDAESAWLEVERGNELRLQRIGPDGRVLESWFVVSGRPVRQKLRPVPAVPAPEEGETAIEPVKARVAERELDAVRVKRTVRDVDGYLQEQTFVFAKDVPPFVTGPDGMARHGGVVEMEGWRLEDFGSGARPSLGRLPWQE